MTCKNRNLCRYEPRNQLSHKQASFEKKNKFSVEIMVFSRICNNRIPYTHTFLIYQLFHDEGPCHIERSPLICRANQ